MENNFTAVIKEVAPQNIISIRKVISLSDFDSIYAELGAMIQSKNLNISGAPIAIYHDQDFNPDGNDTELAFPVSEVTEDTTILPAGTYATTICKGSFDKLPTYYDLLCKWISKNNYQIVGAPFEQYIHEPESVSTSEDFITEIFFKVEKNS